MFEGFGYNDTHFRVNMARMEEMRKDSERQRLIDSVAKPPKRPRMSICFQLRLPRFLAVRRVCSTCPEPV